LCFFLLRAANSNMFVSFYTIKADFNYALAHLPRGRWYKSEQNMNCNRNLVSLPSVKEYKVVHKPFFISSPRIQWFFICITSSNIKHATVFVVSAMKAYMENIFISYNQLNAQYMYRIQCRHYVLLCVHTILCI
jgi:hypothetical protein